MIYRQTKRVRTLLWTRRLLMRGSVQIGLSSAFSAMCCKDMLSHPLGTGYQLVTKRAPLQQQRRAVVTTTAPQTYTLAVILFCSNR
jgi:hypothetical protein